MVEIGEQLKAKHELGAGEKDTGRQSENREAMAALLEQAGLVEKEAAVDKNESIIKSSKEELALVIAGADPLTKGEGNRLLALFNEKGVAVKSAVGRARGWLNTIPALEQLAANNETGLTVSTVDLSQETLQAGSLEEEMLRLTEESSGEGSREELLTNNAAKLKTIKDGQQIVDAEFTDITPPATPEAASVPVSLDESRLDQARKMLLEAEGKQGPEPKSDAEKAGEEIKARQEASHLEGNLTHKREDLENINIALADLLDNQSLSEEEREKERLVLLEKRSVALADFEKAANLYEQQSQIGNAQEKLTTAEKSLAEYLKAHPSEKGEGVEKLMRVEAEARQEYEKLRAELVGNRVHIALEKRLQKTEEKGEVAKEKLISKVGRKIYDAQKWLGERNLSKYFGESLQNKDTDSKLMKGLRWTGRFGAKMASLRTVASVGMLGVAGVAAFAGGSGALAAGGVMAIRRGLATVATYYGAHDGMKGWRDGKNQETLNRKLTPDELKGMDEDALLEQLGLFEIEAKMNNRPIREDENYKALWQEMEGRMKYNAADSKLDDLMAQADAKQAKMEAKSKQKIKNRRIIAGVLAGVVGGGSYLLAEFGPKGVAAAELPKPEAKAPELSLDDAPEIPKTPVVSTPEAAPATEHFDYQGGNSVWQEIEKQYVKRFPEFADLPKGERTYLIDQVKDKIVAHQGDFGLEDTNKVTVDQLKSLNWDEAFKDVKLESPNLSEAQIANIEGPAGHEPMTNPEVKVVASQAPEAELKVQPNKVADVKIDLTDTEAGGRPDPRTLAGEAGPDLKFKDSIYVRPEDRVEDLMEPTPANLEQAAAKEMWAPDKAKTFAYLHADDAKDLITHPDDMIKSLKEFDDMTEKTTKLLAKNEINKLGFFEKGQPVLGADGKMYIIEQFEKNKDQWHVWQMKEDGDLDQIVNDTKGKDVFAGKELHDALGYAEAKGAAVASSVEKFINTDKNFTPKDWAQASKLKEWSSPDGKNRFAVFEGESEDMQQSADKALYDARQKNPAATLIKQTFENADGHYKSKIIVRIPTAPAPEVGQVSMGQ